MGNRGVICTQKAFENNGIGVYGHWQMGMDSIKPLLVYLKIRGISGPTDEYPAEGYSRLIQVMNNFCGGDGNGNYLIGNVDSLDCDNYDNGVYIVDDKWNIVGRHYFSGEEQSSYDFREMVHAFDEAQPIDQQLGYGMVEALLDTNVSIDMVSSLYFYTISYRNENPSDKNKARPFNIPTKKTVNIYGKEYEIQLDERNENFIHGTTTYPDGYVATCSWRIYPWRDGSESILEDTGIENRPIVAVHSVDRDL